MEKLKEFFRKQKTIIVVCGAVFIVSCLSIFLFSIYFVKSGKLGEIIKNNEGTGQEVPNETDDEVNTNNLGEGMPGGTENDLWQHKPKPLDAETLTVVEKILHGIDAISSKKTVGFDYYVTDGDEWDYGADVKQDIASDKLFVDVKVHNGSMQFSCGSDCMKIYYIKNECKYYLGSGYELYPTDPMIEKADINEILSDSCQYKAFTVADIRNDFLGWGLGVENGDIKNGVYNEFTGVKKETKTIAGESGILYTIVNGLDDSKENGWPKDVVAGFDSAGRLRRLEYSFNYGFRSVNFNEFDMVYDIKFPE